MLKISQLEDSNTVYLLDEYVTQVYSPMYQIMFMGKVQSTRHLYQAIIDELKVSVRH